MFVVVHIYLKTRGIENICAEWVMGSSLAYLLLSFVKEIRTTFTTSIIIAAFTLENIHAE